MEKKKIGGMSDKDKQLVQSFDNACQKLTDNPPANMKGNIDGVPGWAVKELINAWKHRFENKKSMVPTIQKYFTSPLELIEIMLNS
jgi:hypothetical protein